jgi:hypothetical protein
LPWPIYKIKWNQEINCKEFENILMPFSELTRTVAGELEETIKNAISLKKLGVEFLEQSG